MAAVPELVRRLLVELQADLAVEGKYEVEPGRSTETCMRCRCCAGLLHQIEALARQNAAAHVTVVRLKLGPLAHIEPDHLRGHFADTARGTVAEGARLDIETTEELHELTLESIDIACNQS